MTRPKLDTRTRRDQILEAALAVVGESGLEGLSVGAVAGRLGLVPSALYRHFPSKDAVLDALLDRVEARLSANVDAACARTPDALDRLACILEGHLTLLSRQPGLSEVVFAGAVHGRDPGRRDRVRAIVEGYLARLAAVVDEGRRAGRVRADVDPGAAALTVLGLVRAAMALFDASGGRYDARAEALRAFDLVRTALEAPDGRRGRRTRNENPPKEKPT